MSFRTRFAASASFVALVLAACGSGGGFPDARPSEPPPHPGTFSFDWTLVNSSQQPVTCTQANATLVTVAIRDSVNGGSFGAPFNCNLGGAVSGSLPIGTYDLAFTLSGASGTIATAPAQTGIVIMSDMTAKTQPVTFVVP